MVATVTYQLETIEAEFQANTFPNYDQLVPDVLGLSNGGYVVAYHNFDIDNGVILLDFYDANGASLGGYQIPYGASTSAVGAPTLAQMTNGNVVVIWDDDIASDPGLRGAIFTPEGVQIGSAFEVTGELDDTTPQVTALTGEDGGFVVTYQDSDSIIRVQVFDENGDPIFYQTLVSTTPGGNSEPVVTGLADGGFVVTWTHDNGTTLELRARIFEADGSVREVNGSTDDFLVATLGDNSQPAITALPNGNWAIAYADSGWSDEDVGISLAIYGPDGNGVGAVRHVNVAGDPFDESDPDITVLDNGFMVVSWTIPVLSGDIYCRIFDQNGNPITVDGFGPEIVLDNSFDTDVKSAISGILAGQFVAGWQDSESDAEGGRISATVQELVRTTTGDGTGETLVGDALRDIMLGNAGSDVLKGGLGKDTLDGGTGGDFADYRDKVNSVVVTLNGAANATVTVGGVAEDTIKNIESVYGGTAGDTLSGDGFGNTLFGNSGNDLLKGGGGADTLDGHTGVDRADYGDKVNSVVVTLNGATNATVTVGGVAEDTIKNIENLVGGSAGDILTGDGLANTFRGGGGADLLNGAAGVDTVDYAEKAAAVVVTLNGATNAVVTVGGVAEDTIKNFENVTGAGGDTLTGDGLANVLSGGAGTDVLKGGAGADTLDGGANGDFADYRDKVNSVDVTLNGANDAIVKVGGVAEDTVRNIENVYGGTAGDVLRGDSFANYFYGNAGNDLLSGGGGNDTLVGAAGADTYRFNTALNAATNVDHITFFATEDTIHLENAVFTALSAGTLTADAFHSAAGATSAQDLEDRIVYNTTTGALYYDSDGVGGVAAVQFAVLDNQAALTSADFFVV